MKNKYLSLLLFLAFANFLNAQVVINEILYNPEGPDGTGIATTCEFIELFGPAGTDISCFVLTDGDFTLTIPSGTAIPADGFFLIASSGCVNMANPTGYSNIDLDVANCNCTSGSGPITLTNSGEFLALFDNSQTMTDGVQWDTPSATNSPGAMQTTSASNGCPAVTVDPTSGTYNMNTNVNVVDGQSIERVDDGTGNWQPTDNANGQTPGAPNNDLTSLAVDLTMFNGHSMDTKIRLEWATSSVSLAAYQLETSKNGIDFSELSQVLTSIEISENFQFDDLNPIQGTNYYRLKLIEQSGTITFSQVIQVEYAELGQSEIFPTLASNSINIRYANNESTSIVQVYTIDGNLIQELENNTPTLDISQLNNGHYILAITGKSGRQIHRFVKQ